MAIDGISINQLRLGPETNTGDISVQKKVNGSDETKTVDGLAKGKKVKLDEENEKDHAEFDLSEDEDDDENDEEDDLEDKKNEEFNVFNIDLSEKEKYELKMNYDTNSIAIIEKKTNRTIQIINADKLAVFVKNLAQIKGTLVNGKY